MRRELIREGLLLSLVNPYTTRGGQHDQSKIWHQMRRELIREGLLVSFANLYTTRGGYKVVWMGLSIGLEITREDLHHPKALQLFSNLLSFLFRCGAKQYEFGIKWDANSFVKVYWSHLLTLTPPEVANITKVK